MDAVLETNTWKRLQRHASRHVLRKSRFQANVRAQSTLDREVDVLCSLRPGTDRTLLLYGKGASTNLFSRTRKSVKELARKLFEQAARRCKAVCVWDDEFHTSKLGVDGRLLHHPEETRQEYLQPPQCKARVHEPGNEAPGCRYFCSTPAATPIARSSTTAKCTTNARSNVACAAKTMVRFPSTSVARGTATWWVP